MSQKLLFDKVCINTSRLTTRSYSTSFSLGIGCLEKKLRNPIYSIYGFVRFADEIVDSFHDYDKGSLLNRFKEDTWKAIEERISLNPILNSFQSTVHQYKIDHELIEQFLYSMEMDLKEKHYNQEGFEKYILGSAEVVGLMCLRVFTNGQNAAYEQLKPSAMKLGSAFQKINFLRDLNADYLEMGRTYFPEIEIEKFDDLNKRKIEESIAADFHEGYKGIKQLPRGARFGVYVAFVYYKALFRKIKRLPSDKVLESRVRIPNRYKLAILGYSFLKHQFNLI
ncbi:MAG: phytoene/squalene synthase family protein [Cyclobacteriaceae bacterium]|nr:phytoene/squalene synthase family protein [Cyclobacteriaceae bacterium]